MTGSVPEARSTTRPVSASSDSAIATASRLSGDSTGFDISRCERMLETEVAHHRADHRTLELALVLAGRRQDEQQLVAVDEVALLVGHQDPIAIAVQRNADVGPDRRYGQFEQFRVCRTAIVVDIATVRRATDGNDLGAQVGQRPRTDLVAGAIGAVEDDLQAFEVDPVRQAGRAEVLVADAGRIDAFRLAERLRLQRDRRIAEARLDLSLDIVGQFRAVAVEELDAVVVERALITTPRSA